jgi:hypothetical protein
VAGRLVDVTANRRLDSTATGPAFAIECDVFAVDVASLTPGRRARVFVDGVPGLKPLAGAVMPDEKLSLDANGRNATVRIQIEGPPASLRPGMFCTARVAVPLAEIELFGSESASSNRDAAAGFTAVPETAVVDTGTRRVVFIETMPGMFDGVEVTLGPRCGDFYPVLTGLEPGQKVAAIGAFLIDAEARLSPNLAAGYFGAARSTGAGSKATTETPPTPAPLARPVVDGKKNATNSKLSQADQKLAKLQKTCPVTDLPLDSMGGPVAVNVEGQRVFICCQGCESRLKRDPQKYLAKLKK